MKSWSHRRAEYFFLYSSFSNIYDRSRFFFTDWVLRDTNIPQSIKNSNNPLLGGDIFNIGETLETFPSLYKLVIHKLLPKKFYYKNPSAHVEMALEESGRGRCVRRDPWSDLDDPEKNPVVCECFIPYRGVLCEEEELRSSFYSDEFKTNENRHVIYYFLDD